MASAVTNPASVGQSFACISRGSVPRERKCSAARRLFERADVFADAGCDLDVEAGFAGYLEYAACFVSVPRAFAVEPNLAATGRDVHAFGRVGAEVKLAGVDQAERLFGTTCELDGVTDDLAVEVNVGFRDCGNVRIFSLR